MEAYDITMTYRNWRGEISQRTIRPVCLRFGATEWHPEPGWLLEAKDLEKDEHRDFALADCQFADLRVPAPAVPDDVAKVCANCGSSMTDAELEAWRAEDPVRRSCCPERNMVPLTREAYDEYRDHCKSQSATIEAQAAELARLREVLENEAYEFSERHEVSGFYVARRIRAALTHPTGDTTNGV